MKALYDIGAMAFALILGGFLTTGASAQPSFSTVDLTPSFWRYYAAASERPHQSATLWTDLYVVPHADVLGALGCRVFEPGGLSRSIRDRWRRREASMRTLSADVTARLPDARAQFDLAFPDMAWTGTVYLMMSGFCFDGRAQSLGGRDAILIGLDGLAEDADTDLNVLVHHELFHAYQNQAFKPRAWAFWNSLWTEGMAVEAAARLNPAATIHQLGMASDLPAVVDRNLTWLASDALDRWNSKDGSDHRLYFQGRSPFSRVPERAGYALGWRMVRHLEDQGYRFEDMARWPADVAERRARDALVAMAAEPVDGSSPGLISTYRGPGAPLMSAVLILAAALALSVPFWMGIRTAAIGLRRMSRGRDS